MKQLFAALFLILCACGPMGPKTPELHRPIGSTPVQHVVIIVQENRTFDNLFSGFPGADTVSGGYDSYGNFITLQPRHLNANWDIPHTFKAWTSDCKAQASTCGMNGFDTETCNKCPTNAAYSTVYQSDIQPYWSMASQYTIADKAFETPRGPSFVAHQFLLSGASTVTDGSNRSYSENPNAPPGISGFSVGGCDSPYGTTVLTIGHGTNQGNPVFPCSTRKSIITELDNAGVTWRYYQGSCLSGLWNAPDALSSVWSNQVEYNTNVICPNPGQVLTDIANGQLAQVTWITPTQNASDHPGSNDSTGPAWVTSIVNAIGQSSYWNSTVIFVTWDDWGGFYDHVPPPNVTSYSWGFRTPLIVISPFVKTGYVSHVSRDTYGSMLKFIEEQFSLSSLGTADTGADDYIDVFNYGNGANPFQPISASIKADYFKKLHTKRKPVD